MKKDEVAVIGGVNVDVTASMTATYIERDSIPGHVSMDCGGVARNIAHDLLVLGHEVRFVTLFGSDAFGDMCYGQCSRLGMDLSLSERLADVRNGLYLCVNDQHGDMVVAVADTDIIDRLTPQFLETRMKAINASAAVVADTNVSEASLAYLLDHCEVPLMVDAVSTAKAGRIVRALASSGRGMLDTLKLNRQEALVISCQESVERAVAWFHNAGVRQVFVTLGADGVYCSDGVSSLLLPALPVDVVNTTGAGDAFLAGVVHAQVHGESMDAAARCGLRVARAVLESPGAYLRTSQIE